MAQSNVEDANQAARHAVHQRWVIDYQRELQYVARHAVLDGPTLQYSNGPKLPQDVRAAWLLMVTAEGRFMRRARRTGNRFGYYVLYSVPTPGQRNDYRPRLRPNQ